MRQTKANQTPQDTRQQHQRRALGCQIFLNTKLKAMYKVIQWSHASRRTGDTLEYFTLTCTPHDEECTPAGGNYKDQIAECTALINQLQRLQPNPPEGAEYFIIENTGHDFGPYHEAGIFYDPQETEEEEPTASAIYAMIIEQNIPDHWDDEALKELRDAGHTKYQPAKVIPMRKVA